MTSLKDLKKKLLAGPDVHAEYRALKLEEELALLVTRARRGAGLTQAELAKRLGRKQAAIARIESGRHLPDIDTLRDVARATGRQLTVKMTKSRSRAAA